MNKVVYLSLGSNVGDRAANLNTAVEKLAELGTVAAVSSSYETEPVETSPQPWFLNCAVKLETEKMPRQLIAAILNLEQEMAVAYGPPPPNARAAICARTAGRNCARCPASGFQEDCARIAGRLASGTAGEKAGGGVSCGDWPK